MRPKMLAKAIETSLEINVPLMIWGSPGMGKSKIVAQTLDKHGYAMKDLRLSTMDTVDLRGFPEKKGERTSWLKPSFFPEADQKTCIFVDEITQCSPEMQGAALQMIYDFAVGDHPFPKDTRIILAGNRTTDRTGATAMISALKNRVISVTAETNYEDWIEFATQQNYWSSTIGYINFQPQHLNTFDPSKEQDAFATPRSWEMVSKLEHADNNLMYDLVSGLIGKEIAPAFIAFDRLTTQIDVEGILKDPLTANLPHKADERYALMTGVSSRIKKNLKKYGESAAKLALRFEREGSLEFTIASIKQFASSHKDFSLTALNVPEFAQFTVDKRELIGNLYREGK